MAWDLFLICEEACSGRCHGEVGSVSSEGVVPDLAARMESWADMQLVSPLSRLVSGAREVGSGGCVQRHFDLGLVYLLWICMHVAGTGSVVEALAVST